MKPGGGWKLWRLPGIVVVLALAHWLLQRSTDYPVISVFGLLGVLAAIIIALTSLRIEDYRDLRKSFADVFRSGRGGVRKPPPRPGRHRRPSAPLSGLLVLCLLAVVGFAVYVFFPEGDDDESCRRPTELRVLASTEGAPSARTLLSQYELSTVDANRCPAVHGFVESADRADLITAVAHSWQADKEFDPATVIGSRPDLWLADSTVDVGHVLNLADQAKKRRPVVANDSIGSSPMVIVSGAPITGVSGEATWAAVVAAAVGQGMGLLTADPQASVEGLLATASYLRQGHRGTVTLPQARRLAQTAHTSGQVALDDGGAAICRFRTAGSVNLALITSEQLWQRYGQASRLDGACAGKQPNRLGGSMMRPTDSLVLDHPLVQFEWNTSRQRSTVVKFRQWLATTAGQRALAGVGLDVARPDCSATLDLRQRIDTTTDQSGETPTSDVTRDPCVPVDVNRLHDLYRSVQRPGVVLLALDTSGSMNDRAGSGPTRLSVATDAVIRALGQVGPEDRFGIWTFSGERPAHQQLSAIGPAGSARRDQAVGALRRVSASGATPLYRTILDGMATVARTGAREQPRAVVVVTDGRDTSSHLSAADTVRQIRRAAGQSGVGLFIIATGEANCAGAGGLKALTDAAQGECREARMAQVPTVTGKLFESLWKGR